MNIRRATGRFTRHLLVGTALATAFTAAVSPASAATALQSPGAVQFNIPAQNLGDALTQFARQSGQQLLFAPELVAGHRSNALVGSFTPREGLMRLLSGSGIGFRISPSGAFLLGNGAGPAPATTTANSAEESQENESGQTIIVTGTNIRGVRNLPTPVRTLNRQDFERNGSTDVQGALRDLPENFGALDVGTALAAGNSATAGLNSRAVAAADLRGLGPESTLTLINGRRPPANIFGQAVDLSVIPLSVVDRIEVVTGGRSAVYGSDAVAGVVNVVTRRSFRGAETQFGYTFSPGSGGDRLQASQIVGFSSDNAGVVAAYDFLRDWALNAVDRNVTQPAAPTSLALRLNRLDLVQDTTRHSGYLSGFLNIGDVHLFADGLYTRRKSDLTTEYVARFNGSTVTSTANSDNEQYLINVGATVDLSRAWTFELTGTYGNLDSIQPTTTRQVSTTGTVSTSTGFNDGLGDTTQVSAVLNGSLTDLLGVNLRTAIGGEYRHETLQRRNSSASTAVLPLDRDIWSAYGELVAVIAENSDRAGLRDLSLFAAGRYDHYSDFGGRFNPQLGFVYSPVQALTFRGAYSRAFRAPPLFTLGSREIAFILAAADPQSPTGSSITLRRQGGNPDVGPERATTWSFTGELRATDAIRLTASYYNIRYIDRITTPAVGTEQLTILQNPSRYGDLIDRSPTSAEVAAILAGSVQILNLTGVPFNPATQGLLSLFPSLVVIDNRSNNIATQKVDGVDVGVNVNVPVGGGSIVSQTNLSLVINHTRQVSPAVPATSYVDQPGRPVSLRLRSSLGWINGPLNAFAFVNYVDGYRDTIATPNRHISSWTTFDLTVRYGGYGSGAHGLFSSLGVALTVNNIFDRDPPVFLSDPYTLGFDPVNSNALGRRISLQLTKTW